MLPLTKRCFKLKLAGPLGEGGKEGGQMCVGRNSSAAEYQILGLIMHTLHAA